MNQHQYIKVLLQKMLPDIFKHFLSDANMCQQDTAVRLTVTVNVCGKKEGQVARA